MTDRLLDARQAGDLLGVPGSWLLTQARRGQVPHVRLGKYVRFDPADLERWILSVKRGPKVTNEPNRVEPFNTSTAPAPRERPGARHRR